MGFIEETGAAQHVRDVRIAAIYEGTNGIQAADLVGRKLGIRGGASILEFVSTMREIEVELDAGRRQTSPASARNWAANSTLLKKPPTGCCVQVQAIPTLSSPGQRRSCACGGCAPAPGCWLGQPSPQQQRVIRNWHRPNWSWPDSMPNKYSLSAPACWALRRLAHPTCSRWTRISCRVPLGK